MPDATTQPATRRTTTTKRPPRTRYRQTSAPPVKSSTDNADHPNTAPREKTSPVSTYRPDPDA